MSFLKRAKPKPRPGALRHPDSPLHRLRLQADLTIPQLAERFSVSSTTVARWLSGDRTAPITFIRALATAAARDVSEIVAAQRAYVERYKRRHRRQRPLLLLEVALPAGVDAECARERCKEAIAQALTEMGSPRPHPLPMKTHTK